MVTETRRRRWWLVVTVYVVVAAFTATPAEAAPGDPDGDNDTLRAQLDAANRGFIDAQTAIEGSRQRQAELTVKLADAQSRIAALGDTANELASVAYRNNTLRTASALLASVSPNNFIDRATAVDAMAARSDRQLREYGRLRRQYTEAKSGIDAEVAQQEQHLAEMSKRKADAEKAVGPKTTTPAVASKPAAATGAPRAANGTFRPEGCTLDDPTTTGCISPRMLNTLQQARAAGFTRYTSCYRSGGSGEHPKGRACDFAAAPGGFAGPATGGDKAYGDSLNNWAKSNAGRLGVMYVIWYRQIWQVATGDTRAYSGRGSPAAEHTNHVHISVY
jgi:peptidoglycan DL-endopeptidase CwlO